MSAHERTAAGAPSPATPAAGRHQAIEKVGLVLVSGMLYSISIASVGIASRDMPPLALTVTRLLSASIILAGIVWLTRTPVRWRWRLVLDMILVGLGNVGLPFMLLAVAMRYISSSLASVVFNVGPPMTLLVAHFVLHDERLTRNKVLGTLISVAGAVLLVTTNASGLGAGDGQGWIGQLLIILASALSAFALVYARRNLRQEPSLVLAAGQVIASLAVMFPVMLLTEGLPRVASIPVGAWGAAFAAAVAAPVIGFWMLFYMINKYSATLGGFSSIATPLFSALVGILFLGEVITLPIAAGTLLLLAGIWSLNSA